MLVTQLHCVTGDGHVNGLGSQLCFQSPGTDGSLALLQPGFDLAADGIGHLSHDGALLGGQLAHHFQNGGQFTLLAQQLDPQLFQCRGGLSGIQSSQRVLLDQLQLFSHDYLSS